MAWTISDTTNWIVLHSAGVLDIMHVRVTGASSLIPYCYTAAYFAGREKMDKSTSWFVTLHVHNHEWPWCHVRHLPAAVVSNISSTRDKVSSMDRALPGRSRDTSQCAPLNSTVQTPPLEEETRVLHVYKFFHKKSLTRRVWYLRPVHAQLTSRLKTTACTVQRSNAIHVVLWYYLRSPPGKKRIPNHVMTRVVLWWYTCRNDIWLLFLRKTKNTWNDLRLHIRTIFFLESQSINE